MPTKITYTNISNTGVTPGNYINPNITVNAQGQITLASNGSGIGNTPGVRITGVTITDNTYTALDDTAVSTSGGYIVIIGSGFLTGCQVVIGSLIATSVSFVNSNTIQVQVPAQAAGNYTIYVTNTDGSTAIRVNGLSYSSMPTWVTDTQLNAVSNSAINIQLLATSNSLVNYTLDSNSTLPTGLVLTSSGLLSGTVTNINIATTYNFTVIANDAELQSTPKAFQITISIGGDPNYYQTILHIPSTDGSVSNNSIILDTSNNTTFSRTGTGVTQQTTFSPFSQSQWSCYFEGGSYITYNNSSTFIFGTGDFSLECWVHPTVVPGGTVDNDMLIFGSFAFTPSMVFLLDSTNLRPKLWNGTTTAYGSTAILANTWTHVAFTRQNSVLRIFINGVKDYENTYYTTDWISGATVYTGKSNIDSTRNFTGYISDLRIIKGQAVYTQNFQPPIAPLTTITNLNGTTSLLTFNSNSFKDYSSNNHAINISTSPQYCRILPVGPYKPLTVWSSTTNIGSVYFDSTSGTRLFASVSTIWQTVQCWIYFIPSGSDKYIFKTGNATIGTANNGGTVLLITSTNQLYFQEYSYTTSIANLKPYSWIHVAVVRAGQTNTYYINGTQIGSSSNGGGYNANPMYIGSDHSGSGVFTGYITGFKVSSSSDTISLPTAPPQATSGCMLLSNMNNIGVYDATSRNVVETIGGAGNSSSQKKWGLSSLFFDGSGDYLRIFDSPINRLRQSAFTIEFWVYFNAVRAQGIVARGSGSTGWIISTNLYLNLEFITASGSIVSAQVLPLQTWLHIAVVREGLGTNQTKLYINGITDGIGTSTQDFNDANTMYIGADKTGGNNAYLYMQDLRITKVARYTNNFNPPTSPFPLL